MSFAIPDVLYMFEYGRNKSYRVLRTTKKHVFVEWDDVGCLRLSRVDLEEKGEAFSNRARRAFSVGPDPRELEARRAERQQEKRVERRRALLDRAISLGITPEERCRILFVDESDDVNAPDRQLEAWIERRSRR